MFRVQDGVQVIYRCTLTFAALPPLVFFQEPPKEDLTVSEKFQLVLDVAQKAQVKLYVICFCCTPAQHKSWSKSLASQSSDQTLCFVLTESVWEDGQHPGEDKKVSLAVHTSIQIRRCQSKYLIMCFFVQFVHVGSARVDSEAVRWSVVRLHLLLRSAVQTAGIHHRYILFLHSFQFIRYTYVTKA